MPARTVLVTGCSTGIGCAAARELDARGWRVFAGVRRPADAGRLRSLLSPRSEPIVLDVTSDDDIAGAVLQIERETDGELAGLVNNAGIVLHGPFELLTTEAIRAQFDVNVFGLAAMTRAFLPLLRRVRGRIVNVGSISGRATWPFNGAYAASKHAVRALTESLRMELLADGIGVSLIEPGCYATAIWSKYTPPEMLGDAQLTPKVRARYWRAMRTIEQTMDRIGRTAPQPDPVAAAIVHALEARKPRAYYRRGRDVAAQLLFASLPPALKDRAIGALMPRFLEPQPSLQRGTVDALE